MIVTIQIPSRLHLSLISLHNDGYRKNGGFGFSISEPSLRISGEKETKFEIIDNRENGFNTIQRDKLIEVLESIYTKKSFIHKCHIKITGYTPSHKGFGSGTSIRLTCIELLYLLNDYLYTHEEIIKESLRGGTSGIGINTYFNGGFVFDIGHSEQNSMFLPSNALETNEHKLPLVALQEPMPEWDIGLCIPNDIASLSEVEEKEFFMKTCPINAQESYETLYHIIFGLIGAVKEHNIEVFAKSLQNLQKCKWKNAERNIYKGDIQDIEKKLYQSGALGVGMSSLGPSLFFVGHNLDETINIAQELLPNCTIFKTKTNNNGRLIIHND